MKTKLSKILIVILHFLLVTCSRTTLDEPINFESEYINKQIILLTPNQFNNYETTSPLVLEVQYHGNADIVFPNNYNVSIYQRTPKGWIEIQEKPILRLPENDIVFSAKNGTEVIRLFTVYPDLVTYDEINELWFYIYGDMKVEQGTIRVAAYMDTKLYP